MEKISNKTFSKERELYNSKDLIVESCKFEGVEDGESPLKESENIEVNNCSFSLRYALWHNKNLTFSESTITEICRAPFWYCKNAKIQNSEIKGVKSLRESSNILVEKTNIVSSEFGWNCINLEFYNSNIESEYAFLGSKNIGMKNVQFKGKYSFQYTKNVEIEDSNFETKDAFWHSKNVVVKNSVLKGEYIGWYSKNLTLINCKIEGTQPFCYCKKLTLINCDMTGCDLAFEYSSVNADINGKIVSIKNPTNGKILYEDCGELILSESKYKSHCIIIKK